MSTKHSPPNAPAKFCLAWECPKPVFKPLVFELTPDPPRRPESSLFQSLLQGDPQRLLPYAEANDMQAVTRSLRALREGTESWGSLHPEERMLVDTASAEMLTESPTQKKTEKPPRKKLRRRTETTEDSYPTAPGELSPFWWL
jgi:hypothetical protein